MAESLFRQARTEMKAGSLERACALFSESYRLDPAKGTLFNLASCEQQRGRTATAWTLFRKLLDIIPADDARAILASQQVAELEPNLPKLRIELAADIPSSISIEVDGIALGRPMIETDIPIDPGTHVINVVRDAKPVRSYTVATRDGELTKQRIEFGADLMPKATALHLGPHRRSNVASRGTTAVTSSRASTALRNGAFVAAGTGGVALIASGIFAILAMRERDTLRASCNDNGCRREGLDAAHRGDNYVAFANVGFVLAAVGLSTGGILLWQSSKETSRLQLTASSVMLTGTLP